MEDKTTKDIKHSGCPKEIKEEKDKKNSCCPEGSLPGLPFTGPEPETLNLNGMRVYEAGKGSKGVIVIHDIYGLFGGRSLEISNFLADNGFHVFFPDLLHGHKLTGEVDPLPNFPEELAKITWDITRKDILEVLVPHMKSKGVETFGLIGFCWGPRIIANLCAESDDFSVGVNIHPTWRAFTIHSEQPLEVASKLKKAAQLYCVAGNDDDNYKEGGKFHNILKENLREKFQYVYYPDMFHGWVNRAPKGEPEVLKAANDAIRRGVDFLKRYL